MAGARRLLVALADHERVAPPTVTRVVAKLEADGLVQRTADTDDRRVSRVATTAAGDALLAELRAGARPPDRTSSQA